MPLAKIEAQDPSKYPDGKINLPASWRKDSITRGAHG